MNFISSPTILNLVLVLIVQNSEPQSEAGRANTLYNLSLDLIKVWLKSIVFIPGIFTKIFNV